MKRSIYSLIGLAVLSASCSTFADKEQHYLPQEAVTATIGVETRTMIGDKNGNAYKVVWNSGDQIIISTGISSKDKAVYTTSDHGTPSASFYPEDKAADFSNGAIAGYPVENMYLGAPDADKEVYFTIPQVQTYAPGSFDSGAMPMISEIADKAELNFFNAAGVIRLMLSTELQGIKVSSICLTTSGTIGGECGYIPQSRKIFFDDSMQSSNEVILDCPDGIVLSKEATAFHIVVPHQTYSDLSIKVTTTDYRQQTFTLKGGKEIVVERSSIATIPLKVTSVSEVGQPKINAKIISASFDSINIDVSMENVTSYYCGFQTKQSFMSDMESGYLLSSIPYATPYTGPLAFSGSVKSFQSDFNDVLIEPGQSYVLWFAPYKKNSTYTADDITYVETMIRAYTSGGTKVVTYSDLKTDYTSISMRLTSAGAGHIYSQLLTEEKYRQYMSENELVRMLLAPGNKSTVFDSESDIFERKFLKPGTSMMLVAVAIDRSGKYGPLFTEEFVTDPIHYNPMKVSIDRDVEKVRTSSAISWTISGGSPAEYRYIFKETDSYLWNNTLEGSVTTAQDKMYLDPGMYYISHTSEPEAVPAGMIAGKEYIIVVVAADAEGNISEADSWIFTY